MGRDVPRIGIAGVHACMPGGLEKFFDQTNSMAVAPVAIADNSPLLGLIYICRAAHFDADPKFA